MLNTCRNVARESTRSLWKWFQATPKKRRQSIAHGIVLVANVFCYGYAISELDGDRELMSAAWREITGELHPDETKGIERVTESEVVPKWQERMHADDITKHLNWFQTFCEFKYGMDDHLEFFWMCDIIDVDIPPMVEDFNHSDPYMNCSHAFIQRHVVRGNDPRCVPWGSRSLPQLQKYIEVRSSGKPEMAQSKANLSLVDPIFDEYTVHRHNPLWKKRVGHMEKIGGRLSAIKTQLSQLKKSASLRRLFNFEARYRPASDGIAQRRLEEGAGCPMRDTGCPYFEEDMQLPNSSELQCYCYTEKFYTDKNGKEDFVKSTCRNHHWGLLMSCAPQSLSVRFHIERIVYRNVSQHIDYTKNHHYSRILWFLVTMEFENIGNDFEGAGGWYKSTLTLQEGEFYGHKQLSDGVLAIVTLLMLIWFLVRRLFSFFFYFPYRVRQLCLLRNRDNARTALRDAQKSQRGRGREARSHHTMCDVVEARLLMLVDGPGYRAEYLSMSGILLENFVAFFVVAAVLSSLFYTGQQATVRTEDETFKVMSGREFIREKLQGDKQFTEAIFAMFYDDVDSHSLAWIALYFRTVFFAIGFVHGLRWLPATLILASVRTCYFLLAYSLLIFGFSIILYTNHGSRFVQFSTLPRASFELVLLTCGSSGHVFDDMYPFQDSGSLYAMLYLSIFVLIAVTIGLNFFITIMLDAYNLASDVDACDSLLAAGLHGITENVMFTFGIPHLNVTNVTVDDDMPTSLDGDLLSIRRSLFRRHSADDELPSHARTVYHPRSEACEDPLSRRYTILQHHHHH